MTQYNDGQLNAISLISAKYEYLSAVLKSLSGVTQTLAELHRQRLETGWTTADSILAEATEMEWKGLKLKYLEALEDNADLNNSMFLSRVEMWMN